MGDAPSPDLPPTATTVAEHYDRWSPALHQDFEVNARSGRCGRSLLADTGTVRVWETRLEPGERIPVHRHVLDYTWTALTGGRARQHAADGSSREIAFSRGQSLHFRFAEGRYHLHDFKNIGDEPLAFLVVELKGGANAPLPLT